MQLNVTQTLMLSFITPTPLSAPSLFTMLHCCNLDIPRLHSPHLAELVDDTLLDVQEVMPLRGLPYNNTSISCCGGLCCGGLRCDVVL